MNFCFYKIGYANSMSTLFWSGRKFTWQASNWLFRTKPLPLGHANHICKCGLAVKALVGITNWLGSDLTKNSFGFFVVENEVKN